MNRLQGLRILITRSRSQAPQLTQLLETEGATVYEVPAINIVLLPDGISELKKKVREIERYDWLILTSVNSVNYLNDVLASEGKSWKGIRIACIGKSTARRVEELGGSVALVPPQFRAESLAEEMQKENLRGAKVLLPRAAGSRPVLPRELETAGATVDEIHIYQAKIAEESKELLLSLVRSGKIDFITFTSSSTVRNFAELAGDLQWQNIPAACIGPITSETLREYGVQPAVEATEFTMPGLVQALVKERRP
jgi:uroporphyrinogen III methyltransferase/synthase